MTAVEHQLEVVVIDHLRELERRCLYLSWGFSSLFDYATSELGYSEAAAWRRIKAMRLCGEVEGARERMRDGSLTLNSAALLQMDHVLPFALGGSAEPDNLRLLCAAHHRHRHSGRLNPASIAQDQIPTAILDV